MRSKEDGDHRLVGPSVVESLIPFEKELSVQIIQNRLVLLLQN